MALSFSLLSLSLFSLSLFICGVWTACEAGWEGSDCSIFSVLASPATPYEGTVETSMWKYYKVDIQNGPAIFQGTLTQASANISICDLDFYVQKSSIPTFGSWIDRDLSTYRMSTLHVDSASGIYYFGVYGYVGCSYTFVFRVIGPCDCVSGHGECDYGSNECHCYTGWEGPKCETSYVPIESGQQDAKASALGWYYYGLDVEGQPKSITFDLMLGGEGNEAHKADLYVRVDYLPSLTEYDAVSPDGGLTHSSIHVTQPVPDSMYYFGVFARESSKFMVRVTVFPLGNDCVNNCSYHGTCDRGTCICNPSYSGASCQKMTSNLILDSAQVGYVADGAWNFYSARVGFQNDLVVHLQQKTSDSDCDLYVKGNNVPNFFNFDYAEFSEDHHYYVYIPNPASTTWNIGVYGFTECEYNITIHEMTECDCPSNAHGSCVLGSTTCVCQDGWGGPQCLDFVFSLRSGVVQRGFAVSSNKWKYFSLRVPKSVGLSVAIKETNTKGQVWLFMSSKGSPTLVTNEGSDRSTSASYHQIAVVKEFNDNLVTFGVFGSPYATEANVKFDILAWYAPF